jgi:predicted GNAT family N-acyltransferase
LILLAELLELIYLLTFKIKVFYVKDDEHRKLGIINRFHRTLKEKLLKLFIAENSTRWIDNIDKIIKNYNNSKHSGIYNFTPKEASKSIIMSYIISRKRDETENVNDNILLFEIGQKVRLLNNKKLFDKIQSKYDDKIYTIIKINKNTLDIEDDKNQQIVIALENENVVGCLFIKIVSKELVKFRQMAIAEKYQYQGFGQSIIRFAENFCILNQYKKIELHARETAIDFYQKQNFQQIGEVFYEVGIPHLKMVKTLYEAKNP